MHKKSWSLATAFALSFAAAAHAQSIPTTPEPGPVHISTAPWLGYGPWYIAQQKGFFKAAGLTDVTLTNFNAAKDTLAAMSAGEINVANVSTNTMLNLQQVAPGSVVTVMLEDFSFTADAILASGVSSIKDLKGKSVAYEQGDTSDVLLNYALAQNGMTLKDIKPVPMPAAQAGSALITGQVPVAVTYEPYVTTALNQGSGVKIIYSAGENPGLISDVLVVTKQMAEKDPGEVFALVKVWGQAVDYYNAHVDESRAIIATALGAEPSDLKTAFDGVRFYTIAQNKTFLTQGFEQKVVPDVQSAMLAAKMLDAPVDTSHLIDGRFIAQAQ